MYVSTTQKGIVFGIQLECGLGLEANGTFGQGTRDALKARGEVVVGDVDTEKNFVHLFKGLFICNYPTIDSEFNGTYDMSLGSGVSAFQGFAALNVNGNGTYETWCDLLVSNGDRDRKTKALDCSGKKIDAERSRDFGEDYTTVGRYLANTTETFDKKLEHYEIYNLLTEGMSLFVIYQMYNTNITNFYYEAGEEQALAAINICKDEFALDETATIYFPVDFDAYDYEVEAGITEFFRGVNDTFTTSGFGYSVGIYGARNTCTIISEKGLAAKSFVSGMSTGYSGNMTKPLPQNWIYNQIAEDVELEIDHDVMRYSLNNERENSVKKVDETTLKYKWSLTGNLYVASGVDGHPFLDASYLGYDCPGGVQSIPFSEKLENYSLSTVIFRCLDEEGVAKDEAWFIVDANNSLFFIPSSDVIPELLNFILEYKTEEIEVETMGGVGRFDTTLPSVTVSGDTFDGLEGSTCPMFTGNNMVLTWWTEETSNYKLIPFKPTVFTNGNMFYALSDDMNAITIQEYPFT